MFGEETQERRRGRWVACCLEAFSCSEVCCAYDISIAGKYYWYPTTITRGANGDIVVVVVVVTIVIFA